MCDTWTCSSSFSNSIRGYWTTYPRARRLDEALVLLNEALALSSIDVDASTGDQGGPITS